MLKFIVMKKILKPTPLQSAPYTMGESHDVWGVGFLYL